MLFRAHCFHFCVIGILKDRLRSLKRYSQALGQRSHSTKVISTYNK